MKKILESNTKIRFQDCDPYNHLNNAKYLDYFLNQREDQVEENYGLNIFDHVKNTGEGWVVGSNQIIYLRPALLMEEVKIKTKLIQYNTKSIRVEMEMWDAQETQLKSLLWIRFMYIDIRTAKVTNHPKDLMDLYEQVIVEEPAKTFEERCAVFLS